MGGGGSRFSRIREIMREDHMKGSGDCRKSSESVGTSSERACV